MTARAALVAAVALALGACNGRAAAPGVCVADEDCGRGVCTANVDTPVDLDPLPLACGAADPEGREPGSPCETGDDCDRGVCVLAGTCVVPCGTEDQCSPDERCAEVFARTNVDTLQPLSACVPRTALDAGRIRVDVQEDVLSGAAETGDGTLMLPLDPLALPGATPTTWFVLEHLDDTSWPDSTFCRPPLCPVTLRTDDDAADVLFDRMEVDARRETPAADDAFTGPLNPVHDDEHADPVVVMIPNGPRSIVTDAGYTLEVSDEVPGDLRLVTITCDTTQDDGATLALDLQVFWVGIERDDPTLDAALSALDAILEPAGIAVGDVRHVEVPGGLPMRGATFDDEQPGSGFVRLKTRFGVRVEQPALFRLSAGSPAAAVNLFLVASIEPATGSRGDPFGVAGGIPAPPAMHGTGASGIAIEVDRLDGHTLAHELGHHLGLFHTSETNGAVFEPLDDTPECRPGRDTNDDGALSRDECDGAGGDNLMFPAAARDVDDARLSAQQIEILRTAPVLRP